MRIYISLKVCGNLHLLCFPTIPLFFYTKECFENHTELYSLALLHTSHEFHNNNNEFDYMFLEICIYVYKLWMKYVHLGLSISLRPSRRFSCHSHCPCSFTLFMECSMQGYRLFTHTLYSKVCLCSYTYSSVITNLSFFMLWY